MYTKKCIFPRLFKYITISRSVHTALVFTVQATFPPIHFKIYTTMHICLTTASYFTSLRYYVYLQFKKHLHQSTSKYTLFCLTTAPYFTSIRYNVYLQFRPFFQNVTSKCTLYLLKLFCSNHCINFTSRRYYVSVY